MYLLSRTGSDDTHYDVAEDFRVYKIVKNVVKELEVSVEEKTVVRIVVG